MDALYLMLSVLLLAGALAAYTRYVIVPVLHHYA
jgi:hypothetical protein